jgi:hypothetical protein
MEDVDAGVAAPEAPVDEGAYRVGERVTDRYAPADTGTQPAAGVEEAEQAEAPNGVEAEEWPDAWELEPEVGSDEWNHWADANPELAAQRVAATIGVPVEHVAEAITYIQAGVPVEQVAAGLDWLAGQQAAVDYANRQALGQELDRLQKTYDERIDPASLVHHYQRVAEANPELVKRVGESYVLEEAARMTAENLAERDVDRLNLAGRVSRYMPQSNPALTAQLADQLVPYAFAQAAADGVDDPQAAAETVAMHLAAKLVNNGAVKYGQRVSDRYAELNEIYRERAAPAPKPEPRTVRYGEKVVDRYRNEERA